MTAGSRVTRKSEARGEGATRLPRAADRFHQHSRTLPSCISPIVWDEDRPHSCATGNSPAGWQINRVFRGRNDPLGPLGPKEYFVSMDRYCGFVYHELLADLLRAQRFVSR